MEATANSTAVKTLRNPGASKVIYGLAKLFFAMLTCIELYYFSAFLTDVALFTAALAALVLSVTGTIDFIVSFFLGAILEVVRMPWGKYRSWLLISPPVVLVTHIFMVAKIGPNDTVAAVIIIIGFVVSHIFWSVAESAWNAMPLAMTDDLNERASLSVWGGRGSMGNTLLFGIIGVPIVSAVNSVFGNNLWGYAILGIILSLLYLAAFWWLFFITKGMEEETVKGAAKAAPAKSNLGAAFKGAVTNPNLLAMIIGVASTYCYMILQSSTMFYFFSYTLGGGAILGFMGTYITLVSLVRLGGSILVPLYLKIFKGNKRAVYMMGFAMVIIFHLLAYLIELPAMGTLIILLIGHFLGSSIMAMQLGLYMDCAVYSEYKTGKDIKGFIMALTVMPVKLGITIKNYVASFALISIGYSATATDTAAYGSSFRSLFLLGPVVICVICIVLHSLLYRLNETKVADMQREINARKAAAQ